MRMKVKEENGRYMARLQIDDLEKEKVQKYKDAFEARYNIVLKGLEMNHDREKKQLEYLKKAQP